MKHGEGTDRMAVMNSYSTAPADVLERLRGLRLGKHHRRILLLAPPPDDEPRVVAPEREGRAAAEAHRRGIRRLAAAGLITVSIVPERVKTSSVGREKQWDASSDESSTANGSVQRTYYKGAVKLTDLGGILVDRLREDLETGKRIRWRNATRGWEHPLMR